MIVCLDTHILIWGIQQVANPAQEDMISKAKFFFDLLDKGAHKVIIPTPVLFEFLTGIPIANHEKVLATFAEHFRIVSFDTRAAKIAADLLSGALLQNSAGEFGGKNKLKMDCQIVAIALSNRAKVIYSYDPDLSKLAKDKIFVREMPEIAQQGSLFEELENISSE